MNADLAFCLDQFADDQLKLVDGILEKIQTEETLEFQKVKQEEESPATIEQHRINKIRKGTHKEDQTIVNKFIQDLHESSIIREQPRNNDNDVVRDTLQAEIKTKLGACSSYVSRLGKLAKRKSNSTEFQQRCHEAVDLLRDPREFEEKFDELCALLEQSDICNCAQNVEQWWKEAFGNTIADINHRNKRFHPTIIEKNFANLSSRSRIVQRATTMIEKRKSLKTNQLDKYDVICNFVQQIQLIDENNCQETKAEDLINKLNDNDNQLAIDYAKTWLKQRDEIRNQIEENIFEKRYEMIKAEFNRQRIAQESKKLALAVLLSRLAIGSDHSEHFNQNLNTKVVQQTSQTFPVVSGDIKDPNVQELSIAIKLVDVNTDEWLTNQNGIQDQFIIALCMAFLIPTNKMRVDGFTSTNSTLQIFALPPYGKNVIESLNGTSVDSSARIEAVRKCCSSMHVKVESISLGDCGLNIENKLMDPQWNRKYTFSNEDADGGQYWETPLDRGGKPYFCPSGWMRFGIKVTENQEEFDRKWGHWYLAYHGTQGEYAVSILSSGLRVSTTGCFYEKGRPRVYVSPSIEYCAHPRYAHPWKKIKENGETCWYQLVFQCRVNPESVQIIGPETLINDKEQKKIRLDPNFDNSEVTWVIPAKEGVYYMNQDIICYGMMMRISNIDPKDLPQSAWWQYALDIKYDT